MRSFLRAFVVVALLSVCSFPARAADLPGKPCEAAGVTRMTEDQTSLIACVKTSSTEDPIWKPMTPVFSLANGNVGIGTAEPDNKLNIVGGVRAQYAKKTDNGSGIEIAPTPDGSDILFRASDSSVRYKLSAKINANTYLDKLTLSTWGVSDALTIDGKGHVAIGTDSLNGLLQVSGTGISWGLYADTGATTMNNMLVFGAGGANKSNRIEIYGPNGRDGNPGGDAGFVENNMYFSAERHYFRGSCPVCAPYTLTIDAVNGRVGINNTVPQYALDVAGTAYVDGAQVQTSDARRKENVKDLSLSGLETVGKLRPVSFTWKEPKDDGMRGAQLGFIAQEIEKFLPQVVTTSSDAEKTKGLKYDEFIPVLTKAIQELKTENDALRARVKVLEERGK